MTGNDIFGKGGGAPPSLPAGSLSLGDYRPRWEEDRLRKLLPQMPVVVLSGARQVGKTTLLRHIEATLRDSLSCRYITLDDLSLAQQARDDPRSLWEGYDLVIIDEVQRDPALLPAVKMAVDEARWQALVSPEPASPSAPLLGPTLAPAPSRTARPRFVLSGSANLLLMQQVAESLAGRAAYLVLRPLTLGELVGRTTPPVLLEALLAGRPPAPGPIATVGADAYAYIARGLMPGLYSGTEFPDPRVWWDGYVSTYLERDLRNLAVVSSLIDFRRVMQALAARTGRLLNQADVARDTATSQATLSRWLNLIEAGHLAQRLPAYFSNRGKRLVKMTRLFWTDPGLPGFLAGLPPEDIEDSREGGPLFENLVYHHLIVLAGLLDSPGRLYHWRTLGGAEVDFVLERGQDLLAFEVKSGRRVTFADGKGIRAFMAGNENCRAGVIVYRGDEVIALGSRVVAVPWQLIAGGSPEQYRE